MSGDVLGREHGILHPGIAGHAHPLVHIQFVRAIKRRRLVSFGQFVSIKCAHAEVNIHSILQGFPGLELLETEALRSGVDFFFCGHGVKVVRDMVLAKLRRRNPGRGGDPGRAGVIQIHLVERGKAAGSRLPQNPNGTQPACRSRFPGSWPHLFSSTGCASFATEDATSTGSPSARRLAIPAISTCISSAVSANE